MIDTNLPVNAIVRLGAEIARARKRFLAPSGDNNC